MKILLLLILLPLTAFTQNFDGWHHLDPIDDNKLGISTNKAYNFLKEKKADTVIVAIIDNGAELTHEDLTGTFWTNTNEIPNNGIDDDKNGYIDDIHGWNFLGNIDGKNLKKETTGLTRFYAILNPKYENKAPNDISKDDIEEYNLFLQVKKEYDEKVKEKKDDIEQYEWILKTYIASKNNLSQKLKKENFTIDDVKSIKSKNEKIKASKEFYLKAHKHSLNEKELNKRIKNLKSDLSSRLNPNFNNRAEIIGDNPDDINDSIYGNNMLNVKGPYHGTGVASVVGSPNNAKGIDGVSKHVKLMILRIVPNGDERDKDIALAIKYAVRNGAQVINMSFAKKYSLHHDFVIEAIEEAEKAGVLIVQAAGNSKTNNDLTPYYPTGKNEKNIKFPNYIVVGASCPDDDEKLVAFFSNYGKKSVDIFAPGLQIKTCELKNGYGTSSGTSIASPVVAGLAAVLLSYYPHLSANELKEIILKSSYKPKTKSLTIPNMDVKQSLEDISVSGGIANLYRAILLTEKEYLK